MKNLTIIVLAMFAAFAPMTSSAKRLGLSAEVNMGFNSESEADKIVGKRGLTGEMSLDDEDVDESLGASVAWHTRYGKRWLMGARLGFIGGETDDLDGKVSIIDLGFSARYRIPMDAFELQVGGAVGLSNITTEIGAEKFGASGGDIEFTGTGYHVLLGVGVSKPISGDMAFVGGAYLSRHGASTLKGEHKVSGYTYKADIEDVTLSQFLVTAGLAF